LFLGKKSRVFCNTIDFIQVGQVGLMGNDLMMELLKAYRNPQTNRVEGFANLGELQSFVKRNHIRFEFEATQKNAKKAKVDVAIRPDVEVDVEVEVEEKKKTEESRRDKKKRKTEEAIEAFLERVVRHGYGDWTAEQLLQDVREKTRIK
jgi:hypothetical protein